MSFLTYPLSSPDFLAKVNRTLKHLRVIKKQIEKVFELIKKSGQNERLCLKSFVTYLFDLYHAN